MKRFVLLIVALLLFAGCSQNSPVAPGNTVYNVTGGGALFKVELKDYPLVVDSVWRDSTLNEPNATNIIAHFDIPFAFNMDTILCVNYDKQIFTVFTNDSIFRTFMLHTSGLENFLIVDSSFKYSVNRSIANKLEATLDLNRSFTFSISMCIWSNVFDLLQPSKYIDNNVIMQQLELIRQRTWFTFEVIRSVDYKPIK